MNLATARATQGAKEVGLRKAIGARKGSLIVQFLTESLLLTLLAGILAMFMVMSALPLVNSLLDQQLSLPWNDPVYVLIFLGVLLLTGVMAGSYPAFVLSAFQPVKVLKGLREPSVGGIGWMRKSLVVVQFALSILLIAATLVVHRQVKFMQGKQLGYQKENLVWFPARGLPGSQYERSITSFSGIPGVKLVALANTTLQGAWERSEEFDWPGKVKMDQTMFAKVPVDYDLLPTLGLKLVAGRNFSRSFGTDTLNLIINEEAARRMRLKNPVGQQVAYGADYTEKGTIIGVVKDFHLASMHAPIKPTILMCRPKNTGIFFARLDGANTPATLKQIEAAYRQLLPDFPFTFRFVDEQYEQMYRGEQQVESLTNAFAILALLVSCLGVFGLATFSVERRTKELGIRKVLGASSQNLFYLICREFMILVAIGLLLSLLPSWYLMQDRLESFPYRLPINWQVFAMAGGIALIVALLTVSTQAIRAAFNNPVKSLRSE